MHMLITGDVQAEISAKSEPTLVERSKEPDAMEMEGVTVLVKDSDPVSPSDRPAKRHRAGIA